MTKPPWLERFLAQQPELGEKVERLIEASRLLREVASQAFVDPPEPPPAQGDEVLVKLLHAAEELASAPSAAHATELLRLLFLVRADSYALARTRATSGPVARWLLGQALQLWTQAWGKLADACRQRGVSPPLRLLLASHVGEDLPWSQVALVGNELPGTPVASLPWGERCAFTGRWWQVDGPPRLRFRCEGSFFTLTEEAFQVFSQAQKAVASLQTNDPERAAAVLAAFPELALPFYQDFFGQTFATIVLREFPSLAVSLHNALKRFEPRTLFFRPHGKGRITYGEVRLRALALAKALQDSGLAPGERIALVFSEPCWEAYLADFACVFARLVSVGIDPLAPWEQKRQILAIVQPKAILGDEAGLATIKTWSGPRWCSTANSTWPTLPLPEPSQDWLSASGVGLATPLIFDDTPSWEEAKRLGVFVDEQDEIYTVIFTSGSTGTPKGVPITRAKMRAGMAYDAPVYPFVVASYQPYALLADRKLVWQVLFNGGMVGFCRRGPSLWEDLAAVAPTYLEGPPALFQPLVNPYLEALQRGAPAKELARHRMAVRQRLGGRVVAAGVGGAPVSAELMAALEACLRAPVREAYGVTEVGTIAEGGTLRPEVEVKLVDRPDLGFTSQDQPYPRGELSVKVPHPPASYLGGEEGQEAHFTEDGFFLTGDLVELRPGGQIRVLGRASQVVKLADGRFICAQEVEELALASGLCRHAALLPTPQGATLVVVPEGSLSPQILRARLEQKLGRHLGSRPLPQIVVDSSGSQWSPENGLLTPSFKPRRHAIAKHYESFLRLPQAPQEPPPSSPTEPALEATLAQILNRPLAELDLKRPASAQGLDSLATAEILALGDARRVFLSPEEVYRLPLADLVAKLQGKEPLRDLVATHSSFPVAATDGAPTDDPEETLMKELLRTPLPPELPAYLPLGMTILSGATGFLGIHLLANLAAQPPTSGPVAALVRAQDHHHARARLLEAGQRSGVSLPDVGLPGAQNTLIWAVACQLEQENLGLSQDLYDLLARESALIVHAAASVRHGASFSQSIQDNVTPTRHLLRLATQERLKAFHFISTLDVTRLAQAVQGPGQEEAPLPQRLGGLAKSLDGYVASKWVAERMVELLFQHCQGKLPVLVSRPGLILWSTHSGYAPLQHWFPALLASCLHLGMLPIKRPAVFPSEPVTTETSARGLEPLPVDYLAQLSTQLTWALLGSVERGGASFFRLNAVNTNPGTQGLALWPQVFYALQAAYLGEFPQKAPLRAVMYRDFLDSCLMHRTPFSPLVPFFGELPALPRTRAEIIKGFAQQPPPAINEAICQPFVRFVLRSLRAGLQPGFEVSG